QDANSYKATEIRAFFEIYFLGDLKITDEMLAEVMRIKQLLLGGSIERVTRVELQQTFKIINVLRSETLRLLPYVDLLLLDADKTTVQADPYRLELALATFNTAIVNITPLLSRASVDYKVSDFKNLMKELKALLDSRRGAEEWDGPNTIIKYLPTFIAAKAFLLQAGPEHIGKNEWNGLLMNANRLFAIFLRTHYLLSGRDLLSGPGLEQLTVTMNELFDVVEDAIDVKAGKIMPFETIDSVIHEVLRIKIITLNIRESTFQKLVRVFTSKVFTAPVRGVRPAATTGVSKAAFALARDSFFGWLDMQHVWAEVTAKAIARQPSLQGHGIPIDVVRELWPTIPTRYPKAHEDLKHVFARKPSLIISDEGPIVYDRDAGTLYGVTQWGFDSLNWKTHFARVVGMGWSSDPVKYRYEGIVENEFKAFYYDVVELAVDLTLVEPEDHSIWKSTFEECNMFMLGGDGNKRLSFDEGLDFIASAMSSVPMAGKMYKEVIKTGASCPQIDKDGFGRPKVAPACYRERSMQKFTEIYSPLPTWTALARSLGPARMPELQKALEQAALKNGYSDKAIGQGDINNISMAMQYIESLYVRFDHDQSGTINYKEALESYYLFEQLLVQVKEFGDLNEEDRRAAFLYVIRYQHAPTSIADKLFFQFVWRVSPSRWEKIQADRLALVQILGELKELKRKSDGQ
ncbi:MAG TPA: hypothetical protein VM432_08510, partial [Bdellovibrionales bacterium]|nr:hypothetical protein [Bdellovibrionales bacterium]